MTENERQAVLRDIRYGYMDVWDSLIMDELFKQIEEEHKEIQQYKAIGSAEGYERAINLSIENYKLYREYKAKVQKFEAIGTLEEFKALKEKLEKINFIINEKHYSNAEECDYGNYYTCENALMIKDIEEILET